MGLTTTAGVRIDTRNVTDGSLRTFLHKVKSHGNLQIIRDQLSAGALIANSQMVRIYAANNAFYVVTNFKKGVQFSEPGKVNRDGSGITFKFENGMCLSAAADFDKARIELKGLTKNTEYLSLVKGAKEKLVSSGLISIPSKPPKMKRVMPYFEMSDPKFGRLTLKALQTDSEKMRFRLRLKSLDGQMLSVHGVQNVGRDGLSRVVFKQWARTEAGYEYRFFGSCANVEGKLKIWIQAFGEKFEMETHIRKDMEKFFVENFKDAAPSDDILTMPISAEEDFSDTDFAEVGDPGEIGDVNDVNVESVDDDPDLTDRDLKFIRGDFDKADRFTESDVDLTDRDLKFIRGEFDRVGSLNASDVDLTDRDLRILRGEKPIHMRSRI